MSRANHYLTILGMTIAIGAGLLVAERMGVIDRVVAWSLGGVVVFGAVIVAWVVEFSRDIDANDEYLRRRVIADLPTAQYPKVPAGTTYRAPQELDDGLKMRMWAELHDDRDIT